MRMEWLITFFIASIYELLALNTRFNIFGCRYSYTIKPQFLKLPLIIPFGWATAKVFTNGFLGFMLFDLLLDPMAIRLGWWKWEEKGLWFGVPLTNYIGWAIVWFSVEGVKWLV